MLRPHSARHRIACLIPEPSGALGSLAAVLLNGLPVQSLEVFLRTRYRQSYIDGADWSSTLTRSATGQSLGAGSSKDSSEIVVNGPDQNLTLSPTGEVKEVVL